MKGLEKSFWLIYSNTHLRTRETLPLIHGKYEQYTYRAKGFNVQTAQ